MVALVLLLLLLDLSAYILASCRLKLNAILEWLGASPASNRKTKSRSATALTWPKLTRIQSSRGKIAGGCLQLARSTAKLLLVDDNDGDFDNVDDDGAEEWLLLD